MSKKTTKKKPTKSKTAKAATEETKTGGVRWVEVEAELLITDAEARKRGDLACEKLEERDALILKRKAVAAEHQATIIALTSEATKLLQEFRYAKELRTVKAREIRNFDKGRVEYHYKGEMIHHRPMTAEDRQDPLPLGDAVAPPKVLTPQAQEAAKNAAALEKKTAKLRAVKDGETNIKDLQPKHDPVADAHATAEQASQGDIADVIRAETSPKTKWSGVDGPRA